MEDRLLWADGTISVNPEKVAEYIFKIGDPSRIATLELTQEVKDYNRVADVPINVKTECLINSPPSWVLPEHYKYLDLDEYLLGLIERVEKDSLYEKRIQRLSEEIYLFKSKNLDDVLKALIYVIDVLKEQNVVWGVGRGSSCSSYLLYLIGLHEVDPVAYDIDITDFLKP